MMKCSFCGRDVPDNARTCPHCGIYISRTFRNENRDISSGGDRVSPEGSGPDDSRQPDAKTENTAFPQKSAIFLKKSPSPSVRPGRSAGYETSQNQRERKPGRNPREQRPEFSPADAAPETPEESPFSESSRQPPPNFCSLCGNSLMPGDRFCSICGNPASGGNPGNSGGSPAGDPYQNKRPGNSGNSGNFDNSGNRPGRRPVNNPGRLRALNRRMVSMSRMVLTAFFLALGGITLAPLGTIAAILHIIIVLKSLPLVWEVISFFDSQGTEYRDWAAKGRGARTIIIALLILTIVIAALFSVLMFMAVTKINSHSAFSESRESALIIIALTSLFLFITNIALLIFAMMRFYVIKRMLKNMAGN